MKVKILCALLFLAPSLLSQNIKDVTYINQLGEKQNASFGDAVKLCVLSLGNNSQNFIRDRQVLTRLGLLQKLENYKEDDPLRRGTIALILARHLKLKDSLFYLLFDSERYAFRVCVAHGIMDEYGSESDILSGEELIEIVSRAAGSSR
jgi:hypothetical protein